jgi:hypothetical protein
LPQFAALIVAVKAIPPGLLRHFLVWLAALVAAPAGVMLGLLLLGLAGGSQTAAVLFLIGLSFSCVPAALLANPHLTQLDVNALCAGTILPSFAFWTVACLIAAAVTATVSARRRRAPASLSESWTRLAPTVAKWTRASAAVFLVALFVTFKFMEWRFRLSHVPEGLGVSTVLYAHEQSWGSPFLPLPGDNETGVIVYELPEATAREIEKDGIEYLRRNAAHDQRWRGLFLEWHATPIAERNWTLSSFLHKYGFPIDVDADVERSIDEAVVRPGSYYAYGRSGLLMLIPAKRRAVFAYAG